MADDTPVPVYFEGLVFPVWVVVDTAAEKEFGESAATHFLTSDDGEKDMPFFTTRHKALDYIVNLELAGHLPAEICDVSDLLIRLEQFRNRGGNSVRFDQTYGPVDGSPAIDLNGFINFIRNQ